MYLLNSFLGYSIPNSFVLLFGLNELGISRQPAYILAETTLAAICHTSLSDRQSDLQQEEVPDLQVRPSEVLKPVHGLPVNKNGKSLIVEEVFFFSAVPFLLNAQHCSAALELGKHLGYSRALRDF